MRTISHVVEEIIGRSPFLSEVISEGVANNAEIARRIKPDVEARLLEKVSESAIAMALHRLSKTAQRPIYGMKFLGQISDITVRSNLIQFIFPNPSESSDAFESISRNARKEKDVFFNFLRGLRETILIVSKDLEATVAESLKKETEFRRIEGLSAITVRLPESSLNVPGVYYPILKAIALEGISLVEVTSVRTEFSIIVADKDIDRAFSVLKKITA